MMILYNRSEWLPAVDEFKAVKNTSSLVARANYHQPSASNINEKISGSASVLFSSAVHTDTYGEKCRYNLIYAGTTMYGEPRVQKPVGAEEKFCGDSTE